MSDEKNEAKDIPLGEGENELEVTIASDKEVKTAAPEQTQAPEAPKGADADDDELSTYSEGVKKRINKLTYKSRESERQRDEAIEFARRLHQENEQLRRTRINQDRTVATEYENRIKAQRSALAHNLKEAIEAGDANRQIELNEELAGLSVETERVRVAKLQIEGAERQNATPKEPEQQQQRQQPPPKPEPKAEEWATRNEWFGQDQPMTVTAFQIHNAMVSEEGFDPASDDYYNELDSRIKAAFPKKFPRQEETRKMSQTVAPGRPTAPAPKSNKIKLSASQVAIARKLGITPEDYARHYQKLYG